MTLDNMIVTIYHSILWDFENWLHYEWHVKKSSISAVCLLRCLGSEPTKDICYESVWLHYYALSWTEIMPDLQGYWIMSIQNPI